MTVGIYPLPRAHSLMERKFLWQAKVVATSGILQIAARWRRWCYIPLGLAVFIVCLFIIFTAFGFHFYQILLSLYSEQFYSSGGVKQFGGYLEVILIVNFSGSKNSSTLVFIVLWCWGWGPAPCQIRATYPPLVPHFQPGSFLFLIAIKRQEENLPRAQSSCERS